MRLPLFVVMMAALVTGVRPQIQTPAPGHATVYGEGALSCGTWTSGDSSERLRRGAWIRGFVSGAGYEGAKLRDTDSTGIEAWISQYCAAHPLDTIATASSHLVESLVTTGSPTQE